MARWEEPSTNPYRITIHPSALSLLVLPSPVKGEDKGEGDTDYPASCRSNAVSSSSKILKYFACG